MFGIVGCFQAYIQFWVKRSKVKVKCGHNIVFRPKLAFLSNRSTDRNAVRQAHALGRRGVRKARWSSAPWWFLRKSQLSHNFCDANNSAKIAQIQTKFGTHILRDSPECGRRDGVIWSKVKVTARSKSQNSFSAVTSLILLRFSSNEN